MTDETEKPRFLTISQAAEELNVNQNQIRTLLRTGEPAESISAAGASGAYVTTSKTSSPRPTGSPPSIAAGELKDEGEPDSG